MNTNKATDVVDQDRRQLLGTAAMGIAAGKRRQVRSPAFGPVAALQEKEFGNTR